MASPGWFSRSANSASNSWYNSGPSRYEFSTTGPGSSAMVGTEAGAAGGSAAFFWFCAQATVGNNTARASPIKALVARVVASVPLRFKPCV